MTLTEKLEKYIEQFCKNDEPLSCGEIPNEQAFAFLKTRIPRIELPDPVIERAYYFRWWVYRKHIRRTPAGYVITEFLPKVSWSGPYNTINCAAPFHLREGRWMRDPEGILADYIDFWLEGRGSERYSSWLIAAIRDWCALRGGNEFWQSRLAQMERLFSVHRKGQQACGLFYSDDGRDGMEFSISGPGLRPTLNSYLYAEAMALAEMEAQAGKTEKSRDYRAFATHQRENVLRLLWTGDFFQTIPQVQMTGEMPERPRISPEQNARELVGYIPWCFGLPEEQMAAAFDRLMDTRSFLAPYGLTTAEQSHPRFMERHDHECLWNGPVWPYATSQTLLALANVLRGPGARWTRLTCNDYAFLLHQYAQSHGRWKDGRWIDWIDEDQDPYTGEWIARETLLAWGWRPETGGYERGKDYNHSLMCDLVLSGLLGIDVSAEREISVSPLIPENWAYFRVENLWIQDTCYEISFDRDGAHYGGPEGLRIRKMETKE